MLKIIGLIFKTALFAIVVLVASHFITWNGKSVSDQVRTTLSSAERANPAKGTMKTVRKKSKELVEDAREAASKIGIRTSNTRKALEEESAKEIPAHDREELQALIHATDAG